MLENLVVVAIIIIVLWLGAMAYYFFISRRQKELADEIEKLREMLKETEEDK